MKFHTSELFGYGALLAIGILGPLLFPNYTSQIAVLWIMVLFAQTWDAMGGQMGYNSLGNILFFGAGMYISAITQVGLFYDVGVYTSAFGGDDAQFTTAQYYIGISTGIVLAAVGSAILAASLGWVVFGLDRPGARYRRRRRPNPRSRSARRRRSPCRACRWRNTAHAGRTRPNRATPPESPSRPPPGRSRWKCRCNTARS